jgi:hypothetical protein
VKDIDTVNKVARVVFAFWVMKFVPPLFEKQLVIYFSMVWKIGFFLFTLRLQRRAKLSCSHSALIDFAGQQRATNACKTNFLHWR